MPKTNGNMTFEEQKKLEENYNKVKADQKKRLNFKPAAKKVPTCAYCKEEGHWIREQSTGKTTCPKLVAREQGRREQNTRRREYEINHQNRESKRAERESGVGGVGHAGTVETVPLNGTDPMHTRCDAIGECFRHSVQRRG